MKKVLLFCTFLCCNLFLQAQMYRPMLQPGRQWHTCNWSWMTHYMDSYQLSDTTTEVNGKDYYVMTGTTYGSPAIYWLREDTSAKKVWIRHGSQEELLYDFSLTAGDTMEMEQSYSRKFAILKDTILASSSDTSHQIRALQLNESGKLQWLLEGVGLVSPSFPFGIGGTDYGIDDMLVPDSTIHSFINAYMMTLYNKYDTTGFCAARLGIPSIPEPTRFSLSPNPASAGKIQLHFSSVPGSLPYRIMATDGRLVQQGEIQNNTPINISTLPPGIYFIQLKHPSIAGAVRFVVL
jgi:hypothetical protein